MVIHLRGTAYFERIFIGEILRVPTIHNEHPETDRTQILSSRFVEPSLAMARKAVILLEETFKFYESQFKSFSSFSLIPRVICNNS